MKILIKKFKEENLKNGLKKEDIPWDTMLNFLPSSVFYGQRPQVWWTKQHDADLLRGTYKQGYANYHIMKSAPDLSFKDLDETYQEFPTADLFTRRLKKLIMTIMKSEQNQGKIIFEGSSSDDENEFSDEEKLALFKFIMHYGIPLTSEARYNWVDLREKFCQERNSTVKEYDKTVHQFERAVQKIRIDSQKIAQNEKPEGNLDVTKEESISFLQNMNVTHFIRGTLMCGQGKFYKQVYAEVKNQIENIDHSHVAYISQNYIPEIHDLLISLLELYQIVYLNQG